MPIIFNYLHWFSALMLILLGFYCLKKATTKTGYLLCLFFLLLSGWCLSAALTFSAHDLETKIELARMKFIFIPFIPISVFFLARCFSDYEKIKWPTLLVLFPIPITTLIIVLSPYHHLMADNYQIETILGSPVLTFGNGQWFPVHIVHARIVLIWALILLAKPSFTNHLIKKTGWIMFFSVLIPFALDTIAVTLFPIMRFIQLVPVALTLSAFSFYYVVFQEKVLQLIPVPIARNMVIDSIQDIYLVVDTKNQLIDFNLHAEKNLNLTKNSFGKTIANIPADERGILSHLNVLLANEHPKGELEIKNMFPRTFFSFNLEKIFSKNAEEMGKVIVIKNISEQKKYETQLTQMVEMRTKLIGIMAHDLIGNVSGHALFLESLLNHQAIHEHDDLKANVDFLVNSSQNITKFVESLLLWSRENIEGLQIKKTKADINHLINDCIHYLESISIQKDIEFEVSTYSGNFVNIDPNMIQTVLRNIIANAIKLSPVNGKILISAQTKEDHIEITISDNGPGVNENELNTFLNGINITSYRGGLGLTLSRDFIHMHNGKIKVQNIEPRGAAFIFTLPA